MVKKEHVSLLREHETIRMTLHRHWIILVFHFFYFIVLILTTWFFLSYKSSILQIIFSEGLYWTLLSIYWIVFLTFILLDWINDELDLFIITESRVIGIEQLSALSRSVSECSLDRVQEVNAHTTGILQTIFGYGDVHIHTASETSNMIVKYAPYPIENARRINNIIQEYRASHFSSAGNVDTSVKKPLESI